MVFIHIFNEFESRLGFYMNLDFMYLRVNTVTLPTMLVVYLIIKFLNIEITYLRHLRKI